MTTIPVSFEESPEVPSGTLGVLNPKPVIKHVDADKIRTSLSALSEQLAGMLEDIRHVGEFRLREVEVCVELNAEGGVALIANAKAGAKGAITLTFSG